MGHGAPRGRTARRERKASLPPPRWLSLKNGSRVTVPLFERRCLCIYPYHVHDHACAVIYTCGRRRWVHVHAYTDARRAHCFTSEKIARVKYICLCGRVFFLSFFLSSVFLLLYIFLLFGLVASFSFLFSFDAFFCFSSERRALPEIEGGC